ncbi:MAG TPA: hypothetical protein VMS79_04310 [Methanomassiliicoccales archaeon]|nr:hypothetical protein [Methanomassiliicoccales archaeon]
MKENKPCCPGAAAREFRMVVVDGKRMGLDHLDKVIAEVRAMDLGDQDQIDEELIRRVELYNYVPKGLEQQYLAAVRKEYEAAPKRE